MVHDAHQLRGFDDHALAEAILSIVHEPLLVLDSDLRVLSASRSFYRKFCVSPRDVQDRSVYAMADGQWNIAELRTLLDDVLPRHLAVEAYEVKHEFTGIGPRSFLLNAREVFSGSKTLIVLAVEDVTDRDEVNHGLAEMLRHKEMLLQEMRHRIANTLQIIASILLLKARTVQSEETRMHLRDVHKRVMSVAAVQQQLLAPIQGERIELAPYLTRLCDCLSASMISEDRSLSLDIDVEASTTSSTEAISIGLIVTELVINALKHAFPADRAVGLIIVTYDVEGENWRLAVSDNGIGRPEACLDRAPPGLGTSIVQALARQLDGRVEVSDALPGTSVSITHGLFKFGLADRSIILNSEPLHAPSTRKWL